MYVVGLVCKLRGAIPEVMPFIFFFKEENGLEVKPPCCKKWQKCPRQETSLENRGCLKVLSDMYQIDSKSF